MSELDALRQQIDSLDQQLVDMLNQRAEVVKKIGDFKRNTDGAPPIYAPDRERNVLDRIKTHNKGPLPDKCLVAIYRELMSGSFYLERPLRIAYLGPEGSFSHTAANLKFGQSVDYEPQPDIQGVFDEIAREHCDFGLAPVENSIAGGITETLDSLIDCPVSICAEVMIAIHHNLLAKCPLESIQKLYSKPEIFNQCRNWLNATLPNVDIIQEASSAKAAQRVANEPNAAAIGSKLAAELYGLTMIYENIEDTTNNVTRFFVIGRESARPTGKDKTSMVFSTKDKAGALVDVLKIFQWYDVNLTNIESRPSRKRQQEYHFFADALGHKTDKHVQKAIEDARTHCTQLTVLGSYPIASEVL